MKGSGYACIHIHAAMHIFGGIRKTFIDRHAQREREREREREGGSETVNK